MQEYKKDYYRAHANDAFLRRISAGSFSADRTEPLKNDVRVTCEGEVENGNTSPEGMRFPSLAMVYSPVQTWENVLSTREGLHAGSIFRDLMKPFMGRTVTRR